MPRRPRFPARPAPGPRLPAAALALLCLALLPAPAALAGDPPAPAPAPASAPEPAPAPAPRPVRISPFSGQPVPRYVSLKAGRAKGRLGPSTSEEELHVYRRRGLPLLVVKETLNWFRVRDPDGVESWMHVSLISEAAAAMATENGLLRRAPSERGAPAARFERGAVLSVERCVPDWCLVERGGIRGWAPAAALWGATPGA